MNINTNGFSALVKALGKAIVEANNFSRQMEEWNKIDWAIKETMDMAKVDKCEWKDFHYSEKDEIKKRFYPCSRFDGQVRAFMPHNEDYYQFRCNFCKSNIRKPKPEPTPIIRKSGGTWVARFEGVDYYTKEKDIDKTPCDFPDFIEDFIHGISIGRWIKFPEEITDEIAKLRPMCHMGGGSLSTLIGVKFNDRGYRYHSYNCKSDICHLATIDDLEPTE